VLGVVLQRAEIAHAGRLCYNVLSVMTAVGRTLGFSIFLLLDFLCCECRSVARCVNFLVSLSDEPLACLRLRFF
jgi:hypothetical protein